MIAVEKKWMRQDLSVVSENSNAEWSHCGNNLKTLSMICPEQNKLFDLLTGPSSLAEQAASGQ